MEGALGEGGHYGMRLLCELCAQLPKGALGRNDRIYFRVFLVNQFSNECGDVFGTCAFGEGFSENNPSSNTRVSK